MTKSELREELAALAHRQWEQWSRTVAARGVSDDDLERWREQWVPYEQLDEAAKELDRTWADKILAIIDKHSSS